MNTLNKLLDLHKKEDNPKIKERILMIISLKKGNSSYEIGRDFNCPHSKILYWKYRYEKEGISGLKNKKISGRPSKISRQQEKILKKTITGKYEWKTLMIRERIKEETGILYTERHTTRLMHKWGFAKIIPRKKHFLSDKKEKEAFLKKTKKS